MAVLASLLFGPGAAGAASGEQATDATSARAAAKVKRIQKQIRGCTNRRRLKQGLSTLAPSKPLTEAASLLATDMQQYDFFGHIDQRGRDVSDRVGLFARKSSYLPIGENIGAGYGGAKGACKAWMNSSGHRANILDPDYTVIGAGFADGGEYGTYYVQVFGRGPRK